MANASAGGKTYIGLDIGGTKLSVNGIDENRRPVSSHWLEVPSMSHLGPDSTIQQIVLGITQFLDRQNIPTDHVAAVGIDSPGPADINGKIEFSANMHPAWEGFQLRENAETQLTRALNREIHVTYENDCNAAALWESHVGNPDGTEVMVLLAPGTGLGGGIVVNGHLLRGARGMAGELGHVEIVHSWFNPGEPTPLCGCGQNFCAEAYASMAALMKILPGALSQEKWKNHPLNQIHAGPNEDVWRKRAFQVRGLAAKGDELCQALFDWQCQAIAKLCRQLSVTVDPNRIVIGGGFIEGGPQLTDRVMRIIRERFKPLAFKKHAAEVVIETAKAGDQAGCLGAALSAWQYAHKTF